MFFCSLTNYQIIWTGFIQSVMYFTAVKKKHSSIRSGLYDVGTNKHIRSSFLAITTYTAYVEWRGWGGWAGQGGWGPSAPHNHSGTHADRGPTLWYTAQGLHGRAAGSSYCFRPRVGQILPHGHWPDPITCSHLTAEQLGNAEEQIVTEQWCFYHRSSLGGTKIEPSP